MLLFFILIIRKSPSLIGCNRVSRKHQMTHVDFAFYHMPSTLKTHRVRCLRWHFGFLSGTRMIYQSEVDN